MTIKKLTKKRLKTKFKASSPFAMHKKAGLNGSDNKIPSPSGFNFNGSMSEQILRAEFVCIIGNDIDLAEQDGIDRRTRTTTLTTENMEVAQETPTNEVINLIQPTNQSKKTFFFSKFSKFNQQCLLDLIEEKDMHEFKNLVKRLEGKQADETDLPSSELPNAPTNPGQLMIDDVKIYLRFSWYSFNELRYSFNELNASSIINPLSGLQFMSMNAGRLMQQQQYQQHMSWTQQQQQQQQQLQLQKNISVPSNVSSYSNLPTGTSLTTQLIQNPANQLKIDPFIPSLQGN